MVIVGAAMMASCSNEEPEKKVSPDEMKEWLEPTTGDVVKYSPITLSDNDKRVRDAHNDFAFRFFTEAENAGMLTENPCLSPFSIYEVLSLAANGDNGETRDELLRIMSGNGAVSIDDLNEYNHKLTVGLPSTEEKVTFTSANSVWVDSYYTLKDSFAEKMNDVYHARVTSLPLATQGAIDLINHAIDLINQWCSQKTNGLINKLFESPLDVSMVLINATYFKGQWSLPFDDNLTYNAEFTNADGSKSMVNMMVCDHWGNYYSGDGMQAIYKSFGENNFEMVFMLPDAGADLNTFAANLKTHLDKADGNSEYCNITLKAPRFKVSFGSTLNKILNAMGINKMFDNGFNDMTVGHTPRASMVIQKTAFEIDEYGAQAAAVSAITMDGNVGKNPESMTIDRPFFYVLRERNCGTVLFIGRVDSL